VPPPDRGAVIYPAGRALVIWGPSLPEREHTLHTPDGVPMAVTFFRSVVADSTVETIIHNLRYGLPPTDDSFPITIIE